jgi:hypothetical protein
MYGEMWSISDVGEGFAFRRPIETLVFPLGLGGPTNAVASFHLRRSPQVELQGHRLQAEPVSANAERHSAYTMGRSSW